MKTKTILKTLAVALLMPAMLLTTACSSDDNIIDSEKSANTQKGYALPVTVNVSRQGEDATRATYTDTGNGTGSLAFSAGDKLFVQANNSPAGKFAGLLDYDSETGKFSGTIMTQNAYSGTADALLAATSSPFAALVPAGYGNYNFFTIYGEGTYNAFLSAAMSKTFALTKKDAVEQFSHETATSYSSGFALAPKNGIASFTISGLTASTEVTVVFSNGFSNITKNVMTNASGVATFAVGMSDEANFNDYTLTVDGNNIALPTKTVEAGHIYNISRSVAATPVVPEGAISGQFSVSATKKVYFSKGNLYYNANATTKWYFATNQWDYVSTATGYPMDHFTWGNISNPTYNGSTYTTGTANLSGTTDWGSSMGTGWRTLTSAEWQHLFNTRTNAASKFGYATVAGKVGIIIVPDDFTDPMKNNGSSAFVGSTTTGWTANVYSAENWSAMETAGCVFLPAAGGREGKERYLVGLGGYYWSSTAYGAGNAYNVGFGSGDVAPANSGSRSLGFSVRLVRDAN